MKHICYILALVLLACTSVSAQHNEERSGQIKQIKMEFIGNKIHLTNDQKDKFWPVYNRYEQELRGIRRSYKQKYLAQSQNKDEQAARQMIENNLDYQEDELNLKKKYKNEMLKVISAQQLADLYPAERDFRKMLVQELKQRRAREHKK